jgi:hypothetical protein
MKPLLLCFLLLVSCGRTKTLDPYPITVESAVIAEAYEANELGGDERFKDKTVRIKGIVREVSKDILGNPYVILEGTPKRHMGVQCSFAPSTAPLLSKLHKGELASFDCRVTGKLIHVQGTDCAINLMP